MVEPFLLQSNFTLKQYYLDRAKNKICFYFIKLYETSSI